MANRNLWVRPFDRERAFKVRRKITIDDKTFSPGDDFDKTLVTTRRLRQLFDQRVLLFADDARDYYYTLNLRSLRHKIGKTVNKEISINSPKQPEDRSELTLEYLTTKNNNELRAIADSRGVLVDGRWGKSRIIDEILKAQ